MSQLDPQHVDSIQFILIDDDSINNFCAKSIIKSVLANVSFQIFTDPEVGLSYITNNLNCSDHKTTILFLDINMPLMNGWEFLEEYEKLDTNLTDQVDVYMVSSSVDQRDRSRALSYKSVLGFISKPLTKDFYKHLNLEQLEENIKSA